MPDLPHRTAGPWADRLRTLARHYPDREVADFLNEAYPDDPPWTRGAVRYWRKRLGVPATHPTHREYRTPGEARTARWRACAAAHGFAHLLPGFRSEDHPPQGPEATRDLRPSEVRVLAALADHGPQTRDQLARRLGIRNRLPFRTDGRDLLAGLRTMGLLASQGCIRKGRQGRPQPLWTLAPGVKRHQKQPKHSGLDHLFDGIYDPSPGRMRGVTPEPDCGME